MVEGESRGLFQELNLRVAAPRESAGAAFGTDHALEKVHLSRMLPCKFRRLRWCEDGGSVARYNYVRNLMKPVPCLLRQPTLELVGFDFDHQYRIGHLQVRTQQKAILVGIVLRRDHACLFDEVPPLERVSSKRDEEVAVVFILVTQREGDQEEFHEISPGSTLGFGVPSKVASSDALISRVSVPNRNCVSAR